MFLLYYFQDPKNSWQSALGTPSASDWSNLLFWVITTWGIPRKKKSSLENVISSSSVVKTAKFAPSSAPTILLLVNTWKIKQIALNAECKFWIIPQVEDYKSTSHFVK